MMTVEKICDELGRKRLCESLGVSKASITNAVSAQKFPPRWYRVVKDMCAESGITCPDDLFSFVVPADDCAVGKDTAA